MQNTRIKAASQLLMHCRISLEDGTVVEDTFPAAPLQLTIGDGSLFHTLENLLIDLQVGDQQSFYLTPDQAFGYPDPANEQWLPRQDFPADMALNIGNILNFTTPNGEEVPGTLLEINDQQLKVDFNHPLSGYNIKFDVEILQVGIN